MLRLRQAAYRAAYRVLWVTAFIRGPRGRGAKAVVVNGGEVLLVRHTYGPRRWELPGGGIRRGEAPEAGITRELREELGLNAVELAPLAAVPGPGRFRHRPIHYYLVELAARDVHPDPVEIAETRWCNPATLPGRVGEIAQRGLELAGLTPPAH